MASCRTFTGMLLALGALLLASRPAPTEVVTGFILKVDVETDQLHVLRPDGRVSVFDRLPRTVVTVDRQPFLFELLEAGWRVVIYAHGRTGVATRIDAFTDDPLARLRGQDRGADMILPRREKTLLFVVGCINPREVPS